MKTRLRRAAQLLGLAVLGLGALAPWSGNALAQEARTELFARADAARDAATAADAGLLAPAAFERAQRFYAQASEDLERGRGVERVRNELASATEAFNAAAEAAQIAQVTLASLIKTRDDAASASADTFANALWLDAEETLDGAVRRLEQNDIRAARAQADEAETLYREAELNAIKAQYLSQTRALLAEAERARVPRFAPETFARAQSLLAQAERELNENRYDTDVPRSLAQQANYEALHAIHLAERIQAFRDGDWSEEDIILAYEQPLVSVAAAADIAARLDAGVDPVVAELVDFIESLREQARQSELDLADTRTRVTELEEEVRALDEQLGGVSQERVALVQRLEAEARLREQFESIDALFTRDEARVTREGNVILLRLVGLTFPSGEATVGAEHRALLEKVSRAAGVFPTSQIVIEGHTDSYGRDDDNLSLSRQRAEAVSEYLSAEFGLEQFRITAVGYGETQPIANNETPQGRARNRRIDVSIEPQIE